MAVVFATNFGLLVNNASGSVQVLPDERVGGKSRNFIERVAMSSQPSTSAIAIARIPYGSAIMAIQAVTDTSLGSAGCTLSLGDGNSATRFSAAASLQTTNTPQFLGPNGATCGVPLTTAYTYDGTASTQWEDVLATIGGASLPSSGTITFITEYIDYGS